jgi:hypothetical protein
MSLEQIKIREIVRRAVNKSIDIPEFQREFVWDPEQVKFLIESLYREYPVGSFLLWDSSEYQESKTAQGTQPSLWIIDGQQRTTALCLLFGQKPFWWPTYDDWNKKLERFDVMANILPETDGRLEFALPNPVRSHDPRWVSVRSIVSVEKVEKLTSLAEKTVKQISEDQRRELFSKIHSQFQKLWQVRERDIPVIKVTHEIEDVAEIFARLNQAGTRVKEADVVLALAAARNPGWVREEYLPFRNGLEDRGWDLDAGVYIRTMAGIGYGRARLIEVPRNLWSPDNLPNVWKRCTQTVAEALKMLSQFGILSPDLLPSTNSLITLFVLHNQWSGKPRYSFEKALHWFLQANRDGRYGGSAITSLNEDVRAIHDAKSFEEALDNLLKRLRVPLMISPDEFMNRYDRAGNRFLRLMLYLIIYNNNATDLVDHDIRLGYDKTGSPITSGFEPQWHHIYPRSILKKENLTDDTVHALANITVLNERSNVNKISNKEPWLYIQQYNISDKILKAHLVPESFATNPLKEQWEIKNFEEFCVERSKLLVKEANSLLERLKN